MCLVTARSKTQGIGCVDNILFEVLAELTELCHIRGNGPPLDAVL